MGRHVAKNGIRSYYRCKRINKQPTWVCVATGFMAAVAAAEDDARRMRKQAELQNRRTIQARWKEADEPVKTFNLMADFLTSATLTVAGLYEHFGEWRKRGIYDR
jgi:hypothetical protein